MMKGCKVCIKPWARLFSLSLALEGLIRLLLFSPASTDGCFLCALSLPFLDPAAALSLVICLALALITARNRRHYSPPMVQCILR